MTSSASCSGTSKPSFSSRSLPCAATIPFPRALACLSTRASAEQPLASARNELELALSYEHGFALGESSNGRFAAYAAGRIYYDAAYLVHRDFYDKPDGELLHLTNWVESVRAGKAPNAPVEAGVRAAAAAHLSNQALRSNAVVAWKD